MTNMDIKDLNKQQLILLTLLICFVVSIATGIVTVSLMQKVPQVVPQTINRIIERTIQNVSIPTPEQNTQDANNPNSISLTDNSGLINIYDLLNSTDNLEVEPVAIGQGIIISEAGLIMVNSSVVNSFETYTVKLDKSYFQAKILKKFDNGFTILKIVPKGDEQNTDNNTQIDINQ